MTHPLVRLACGTAALVLATVAAPTGAAAQESPLVTGSRIRVSATVLPKRVEGTFLDVARDTFFFARRDGLLYRIPLASVTRVELGTRTRWAGAKHGAIWGAGAGCLLECTQAGGQGWSTAETVGAVSMVAVIGAGIGAIVRADEWHTVPLPRAPRIVATSDSGVVTPTPRDSATIVALTWAPSPGRRIRLRSRDAASSRTTGTVVRRTADSLWVTVPPARVQPFSRPDVTSIEVSDGIDRGKGAVRGALWTIGIAASIGAISCAGDAHCGSGYGNDPGVAARFVVGGVMGGLVGVVFSPAGMLIGSHVGVERWVPFR